MKRITSKMVINGLKKLNRVPYPGEYITDNDEEGFDPPPGDERLNLPGNGGACGLGAVGFRNSLTLKTGFSAPKMSDYHTGFMYGFDGDAPLTTKCVDNNEEYLKGFCDGVESHLDALIATNYLTRK